MSDFGDSITSRLDPVSALQSVADAALSPDLEMMRREEGESPETQRAEMFSAILLYVFGGSLCPVAWAERCRALVCAVRPSLAVYSSAEFAGQLERLAELRRDGLARLLARRAADGDVARAQGLRRVRPTIAEVLASAKGREMDLERIITDLAADGASAAALAKRSSAYALAVAGPLLCLATQEEIAGLFQQGRAASSLRVRRVFNDRVEASGGKAQAWFQKSSTASATFSERAKGNKNRARGKRADRGRDGK